MKFAILQLLLFTASAQTFQPVRVAAPGTGGVTMFQQLGDFSLSYTGSVGTIGAQCSPVNHCAAAIGQEVYQIVSPATVTITGPGPDVFYMYVNPGGTLIAGYSGTHAPACFQCATVANVQNYPLAAAKIGRFAVNSQGVIVAAFSDLAAIFGPFQFFAGHGIMISTAGNVITISCPKCP